MSTTIDKEKMPIPDLKYGANEMAWRCRVTLKNRLSGLGCNILQSLQYRKNMLIQVRPVFTPHFRALECQSSQFLCLIQRPLPSRCIQDVNKATIL